MTRMRITILTLLSMMVMGQMFHGMSAAEDGSVGDKLNGQRLYLANCLLCHGYKGDGEGPYSDNLDTRPRDFTDSEYMNSKTDGQLFKVISRGGMATNKSQHMRGWGLRFQPKHINDLVAYIRAVSKNEKVAAGALPADTPAKTIFSDYCSGCHSKDGRGKGPLSFALTTSKPANLADPVFRKYVKDEQIYNAIKEAQSSNGISLTNMPAWKHLLSDDQINKLVKYIRTL